MRRQTTSGIHAGRLLLLIGLGTAALAAMVLISGTVVAGRIEAASTNNRLVIETRQQVGDVDELANQVVLAAREQPGPLNTPQLLERRGAVLVEAIEETGRRAARLGDSDSLAGTTARIERLVDAADGMVDAGSEALGSPTDVGRAESLAILDVVYRLFRHDLAELRDSLDDVESEALRTQASGVRTISRWILVAAAGTTVLVLGAGLAARRISGRERSLLTLLRERSITDALTSLLNRRGFHEQATKALDRRGPSTDAALLFLDLDGFKTVNDSLGHPVGDAILVAVADRIRNCTREQDVVARLGGDEFAVLLRWPTGSGDPARMADRLRTAIAETIVVGEHRITIGVSIGLRRIGADEDRVDVLLRDADVAMYRAKREPSIDGVCEFDRRLVDDVLERRELETALRRAIRRGELSLHYQPIVDRAGDVVGAEALVRWFRDGSPVYPDRFLPIATDLGLMPELDHFVLCRATSDIAELNRTTGADLRISVNIAAEEAERRDLCDRVEEALAESGLDPERLVIEVTEQGALDDLDRATEVLDALRSLGVRTALDDFGTGNSALHYLDKLPIDILKIDRSFIPVEGDDDRRHQLFATVVELGNRLGFGVVAEGIEDNGQQRLAVETGCSFLQGYHLGRPAPLDALRERVTAPTVIELGV